MPIETPAVSHLRQLGVDFEVKRYGRARSLAEAAEMRGIDPANLIKTMVVRRGEGDYVLVLVPGDRVIAWPRLRELLGVNRLSMPDAEEAKEATGYERGTITPFGTTRPLPVVADERIGGHQVSIGGGDHGLGILIEGDLIISLTKAVLADVTDPQ